MVRRPRLLRRFVAIVRSDPAGVGAGFVALLLSSGGDLVAGLALGAITGTLEALPGLLVLVPAAIGMRGNIFGGLGSRFSTAIHAGTFRVSRRLDTLVGQNVAASLALSLSISLVLAVLAKAVSVGFGVANSISIVDFLVISVVGGILSSIVVLLVVVVVTVICVRFDLDLDNVSTPIVTAAGDIVTLPSLFLATYLVGVNGLTPVVAGVCIAAGLAALVMSWRARRSGGRDRRYHDPEAHRLLSRVSGVARAGSAVPGGRRRPGRHPQRESRHQTASRHRGPGSLTVARRRRGHPPRVRVRPADVPLAGSFRRHCRGCVRPDQPGRPPDDRGGP